MSHKTAKKLRKAIRVAYPEAPREHILDAAKALKRRYRRNQRKQGS